MIHPFTKAGPPENHDPILCICKEAKEICQVWFVWTVNGVEKQPHYWPVCSDCWLRRITEGNA